MESHAEKPSNSENLEKRVTVPISLTVFVPIDLMIDADSVDENGQQIVTVEQDDMSLITRAVQAANDCPAVIEAIDALLGGLASLRKKHPSVKAKLNPFVGVLNDRDL
jgi:hypothetical protein